MTRRRRFIVWLVLMWIAYAFTQATAKAETTIHVHHGRHCVRVSTH